MGTIPRDDPTTRAFLRHALATIAYRAGKAVRGTPEAFAAFRATPDSPSSAEILAHMGDLIDWVLRMAKGEPQWNNSTPLAWEREIDRFFSALRAADDYLASAAPIRWEPERLFQGGIADALTHTGQLAMLRRLSGHKMKGENYSKADIVAGRVGLEQTPRAATARRGAWRTLVIGLTSSRRGCDAFRRGAASESAPSSTQRCRPC